jgi:hypothetical protein
VGSDTESRSGVADPRFRIEVAEAALAVQGNAEEEAGVADWAAVLPAQESAATGGLSSFSADALAAGQTVVEALRSVGWGHLLGLLFVTSGVLLGTRRARRAADKTTAEAVPALWPTQS